MRRAGICSTVVFMVFAVGATAAVSASATLWLNTLGESFVAKESSTMHVLLALHTKGPFASMTIHCEVLFDGWVGGPNGNEDEVTKFLSATGEEIDAEKQLRCEVAGSAGVGCKAEESASVYPVGWPWLTKLVLENGITYDDFTSKAGGEIGYHMECNLTKITNECRLSLERPRFAGNTAAGAEFGFENDLVSKCSNRFVPEGRVLGKSLSLGFTVS